MADPIGATLDIDISQLKDSLAEANKLIKRNEANWLENASAMGDWTQSEEGLTDRMRFLSKTIEQQEKNVEGIIRAKREAIEQYGEESREVDLINSKLKTQSSNLMKSRKEYSQLEKAVEKMTAENEDANEELKETTQESKKASKALDNLEDSAKDAGDGFTIAKGAIAGFIANGLTAMVSAVGNAVGSLLNLTESTLEYRREMGRITTVAEQVGVSGDRIIDKWMDVNAVIQDDSSVTEGLNNLMTAGFTAEKQLDAITKGLEGASIQWAETLKFEGLSDSLQEWIGSDGASLTGQFAELLERLGYNLDDVTEATKGMTDEQRRNWAIQTLQKNGLMEVSDAYREANKDMIAYNKANSDLLHAQSMLGEQMQPFVTTIKQSTADILYSFLDMVNGVEGAGDQLLYNVGYLAGKIYGSVRDLISQMLPTISAFFPQLVTLITENLPSMVEQGVAIITSIINGISQNVPLVVAQISEMLSGILLMIAQNAPELLNSAIGLFGQILLGLAQTVVNLSAELPTIITTVTDGLLNGEQSVLDTAIDVLMGIVEAIPTIVDNLLANMPQIIDSILTSLSNAIPRVFAGAISLLSEIVRAIPSIISSLANNLPKIIDSIIKGLSNGLPKVATGAVNLFMEIIKAIPSIAGSIIENMPKIITAIVKGLAQGAGAIFSAGVDLIKGLVNGILSFDVVGALKGVGNSILNGFKNFFGIQSPSKLMRDEVGYYIGEGVAEGIEESTDDIAKTAETVGVSFSDGFMDGLEDTKKDIEKTVESTVSDAVGNASLDNSAGKSLAQEVGEAVKQATTDYSKYVEAGISLTDLLKEGNPNDIIGEAFSMGSSFGGVWGALADSVWQFISNNIFNRSNEKIAETAQTMATNLMDTIISFMTNLPQIVEGAITFLKNFAKGLIEGVPELIKAIPQMISDMVTALISEGIPMLFEVGAELIKGLIEGMFSISLWDVLVAIGKGIVNGFKALFGIKSPSKVMADEIGKNLALGMEEGLVDNLGGLNSAIRNGVDTSLEMDGIQRKYVTVNQTNNYAQAHSRYELYKSKHDTANAVRLAMQGV